MTGNFIMISEEDLEKAFTKMLENYLSTHKFAEKSSTDESPLKKSTMLNGLTIGLY